MLFPLWEKRKKWCFDPAKVRNKWVGMRTKPLNFSNLAGVKATDKHINTTDQRMKDITCRILIDRYLAQWLHHHFGNPVRFPNRSYEHEVLIRSLSPTPRRPVRETEECGNRLLVPVDIVIPDNRTRQPEYYSHLSTYGRRVMLDALNGLFRMALWSACSRYLLSRDSLNEAVEQWCRENGISVENREGVRQKLYRMRKQYQKIGINL